MCAALEYLGEDGLGCIKQLYTPPGCITRFTHTFFIGITEIGSFISRKPGWESNNVTVLYAGEHSLTEGLWDTVAGAIQLKVLRVKCAPEADPPGRLTPRGRVYPPLGRGVT